MMKMNRFLSMTAASLVGMAFTACSSDDGTLTSGSQNTSVPSAQTYTMSVTAQKGGVGTRALSFDGSTLIATWTEGEHVSVYNSSGTEIGLLTAQSTGTTTTLKGALTVLPAVSDALTLKFLSTDYNTQDGTVTDTEKSIDKVCDYAVATVTVSGISGTDVTTTDATFVNQQAVIKFTLQNVYGSALPSNPTAFTVTDGTSTVTLTDIPAATYTANGNGVLYVAFPATDSSAAVSLTATVGDNEYICSKTDITFNNSEYYIVTAKMVEAVPEGAINGRFSVSATKQVYFSKGNLQLIAADTWRFAPNQWDYFAGSQYDNHRDLFGWGTGNNPNLTSKNDSDYEAFTDWGSNTALQSQLGTGWRTMSGEEWTYLLNSRTVNGGTGDGYSYTWKHTVNGVECIVIYPDNYIGPTYTSDSDWSTFDYKGCVFLPAAGDRSGTAVYNSNAFGPYWTSSLAPSEVNKAGFVKFYSHLGVFLPPEIDYTYRHYGYSVRLVRDVE